MHMWSSVKPILAGLFGSKKFLALLAGAIVWLLGKGGLAVTEADVSPLLMLIGAYLGAQGIADLGKEKIKEEAKQLERLGKSKATEPPTS